MRLTTGRIGSPIMYVALSVLLAGTSFAQGGRHAVVWKLNLAKSTYSAGPAPKSATTTIESAGSSSKVTVDLIAADGTPRHWEVTAYYDGKECPVIGDNPDADTLARWRVNATTGKTIAKKAGKVTLTQFSVVSKDGNTRTVTTTGVDGSGHPVRSVAIYDKQ
jgi:hypothetical protein